MNQVQRDDSWSKIWNTVTLDSFEPKKTRAGTSEYDSCKDTLASYDCPQQPGVVYSDRVRHITSKSMKDRDSL
jgi:hypothetical protein